MQSEYDDSQLFLPKKATRVKNVVVPYNAKYGRSINEDNDTNRKVKMTVGPNAELALKCVLL